MTSLTPLILTLLLMPALIIAAPPTSKYTPGETTDPNCAPGTTNCDILFTGGDTTDDAFLNNQVDQRVELTEKSDGTARDANTEFVITDAGDVSVGISDPQAQYHSFTATTDNTLLIEREGGKQRNVFQTFSDVPGEEPQLILRHFRGTKAAHTPSLEHDELGTIHFAGYSGGSANSRIGASIYAYADSDFTTDGGGRLEFKTRDSSSTEFSSRMTIKNDGRVGIGTTVPSNLLHLYSDGDNATLHVEEEADDRDPNILIDGAAARTRRLGFLTEGQFRWTINATSHPETGSNAGSHMSIYNFNDDGSYKSTAMTIRRDSNNVGIGVATPTARLHTQTQDALIANFYHQNGTTNPRLYVEGETTGVGLRSTYTTGAGDMFFYSGANVSPNMTIKLNGNVGVGTASPERKLHISDAMRLEPISGSQPASPSLGDLYVDGDTNELCFYNGTAWAGATGGSCD